MSAVTQNDYTQQNNSTVLYNFTFPYLKASDVKVSLDAVDTTAFTLANATTIQLNSVPAVGTKIKIFRETSVDNLTATFYAGSAIKSEDLNDNFTQNLYVTQEVNGRYISSLGGTMTGNFNLGEDADITFEGATDDAHETTLTVEDPTADRTITLPNVTGTVITTGDTGTVTGTMLAEGTVTSTDIADGTIVNADINASAAIAGTKVSPDFGSQNIATTGTINDLTTTELSILDGATVTTDELNKLDGVTATTAELNIVDGVTASTAEINKLDGVTATTTELNLLDGVTATTTELNLLDGVTATTTEINHVDGVTGNVQTQLDGKQPLDSELTTLSGMQSGTASKLADSTALTADIADLNQIDGLTKQTTISDTDASFPTSGAVVDYVTGQIDEIGGFEAITNETQFPNTQPGAGVAISIADAAGIQVDSNGQSTTGRTVGGSTVTINGIASNFYSSTVASGIRFIVTSTGSGQVYNYHKATLAESDLVSLSGDINDFAERYRVGGTNPSTSLDNGDLFFNTSTGKMLVYNGTNTAWEEVQSIGNFFISTLSPAFDGSTQNFTLSDAPTNVQQVILSINGVVQKPNAGSSVPSEGFALDGSTVKLSAAPAAGDSYFAIVMGSTVNIGTPSNNTVTTAILQNLSVSTAKIQDEAVTLAKLPHGTSSNDGKFLRANNGADPTFETVDLTTKFSKAGGDTITGDFTIASGTTNQNINVDVSNRIRFDDNLEATFGSSDDLKIVHNGVNTQFTNTTGNLEFVTTNTAQFLSSGNFLAKFIPSGACELYHNGSKKFETTSAGGTVTGTLTATAFAGDGSALTGLASTVANGCIYENDKTITSNFSTSTTKNSMSAGPITIGAGVTLTIPTGSFYTIV